MASTTFQVLDALKNAQTVLAGSNAFGHLSAGATLYDEDGVLVAKAEDAAHTSGDKGFLALGVRRDTASTLASANGDYTLPIYDSSGRLWVNVNNTVTTTGTTTISGTATISGAVVVNSGTVGIQADLNGSEQSGVWTLSGTPGTITTISIPDAARIVTLLPSALIRVSYGKNPAAVGSGAFADGSPVEAGTRRSFILPAGTGRDIRLRSTVASPTVTVEVRA
jgi:hypothetical protein